MTDMRELLAGQLLDDMGGPSRQEIAAIEAFEARGVFAADNSYALTKIREAGVPYTFLNHFDGHPGPYPVTVVIGSTALIGNIVSTK